jgi:magnesium transporter
MLRLLIPTGSGYTWVEHAPPAPFPDEFLWADLFEPTPEEEKAVESLLTVDVPTRDEMKEIETSNRL